MSVEEKTILSKEDTHLPFDIVMETHFKKFYAVFDNGMKQDLSLSDVINAYILRSTSSIGFGG